MLLIFMCEQWLLTKGGLDDRILFSWKMLWYIVVNNRLGDKDEIII